MGRHSRPELIAFPFISIDISNFVLLNVFTLIKNNLRKNNFSRMPTFDFPFQSVSYKPKTSNRRTLWRTIPAKIHVLYLQHNILNLTQNFCISNSTFEFNTRLLYLELDISNLTQDFCIYNTTFRI